MSLRDIERESIRAFVQDCADKGYLSGRVLDYGCGKSPYLGIVAQAGGEYWGWDHPRNPGYVAGYEGNVFHISEAPPEGPFDAILCTQVLQYVPLERFDEYGEIAQWGIRELLSGFCDWLQPEGSLVATGPTNWPQCEAADLHRFTLPGIEQMLYDAGFSSVNADYRAYVTFEGERWPLGWWAVAQA